MYSHHFEMTFIIKNDRILHQETRRIIKNNNNNNIIIIIKNRSLINSLLIFSFVYMMTKNTAT